MSGSKMAQWVKNLFALQETQEMSEFNPWVEKIPWRRAWQRTPVFLPGESHGQRSLAGYSPQGCKVLDTTDMTEHAHTQLINKIARYLKCAM